MACIRLVVTVVWQLLKRKASTDVAVEVGAFGRRCDKSLVHGWWHVVIDVDSTTAELKPQTLRQGIVGGRAQSSRLDWLDKEVGFIHGATF